jgi:hypothetical protein
MLFARVMSAITHESEEIDGERIELGRGTDKHPSHQQRM